MVDIFEEVDFEHLDSLGENSSLFRSDLHMGQGNDWDVNDLEVFSGGFDFGETGELLRSPTKASGGYIESRRFFLLLTDPVIAPPPRKPAIIFNERFMALA